MFHYYCIYVSSAQQYLAHFKYCLLPPSFVTEAEIMSIFPPPFIHCGMYTAVFNEVAAGNEHSWISVTWFYNNLSVFHTGSWNKTHFLNSNCCPGFPMTKHTGLFGRKRTAEGLLAERYMSVSTWHRPQLQTKQPGLLLL